MVHYMNKKCTFLNENLSRRFYLRAFSLFSPVMFMYETYEVRRIVSLTEGPAFKNLLDFSLVLIEIVSVFKVSRLRLRGSYFTYGIPPFRVNVIGGKTLTSDLEPTAIPLLIWRCRKIIW